MHSDHLVYRVGCDGMVRWLWWRRLGGHRWPYDCLLCGCLWMSWFSAARLLPSPAATENGAGTDADVSITLKGGEGVFGPYQVHMGTHHTHILHALHVSLLQPAAPVFSSCLAAWLLPACLCPLPAPGI